MVPVLGSSYNLRNNPKIEPSFVGGLGPEGPKSGSIMISLAHKPLSLSDCSSFKLYIYVVKSDGDGSLCYFVIQYVITPKLQSPWFKGPWPSPYKANGYQLLKSVH